MFGLSKQHWKYIGAFTAGTFLGGYVLGVIGRLVGKVK